MTAYEHCSVGDEASGGAVLNLGGESGNERRWAPEKPARIRRY